MERRILPAGERAQLVELADGARALALLAELDRTPQPLRAGIADLVPGARTLLVRYTAPVAACGPLVELVARAADRVAGSEVTAAAAADRDELVLPTRYRGPDLADVARLTGLTETEVVARHTAARYTVAFCGFAPGFGYLTGGDPALAVPRRPTPRTRVPAGAVALAGGYSGVYPRPGPGGWQLLGVTDVRLWDLAADPPALLRPGRPVRFEAVG